MNAYVYYCGITHLYSFLLAKLIAGIYDPGMCIYNVNENQFFFVYIHKFTVIHSVGSRLAEDKHICLSNRNILVTC